MGPSQQDPPSTPISGAQNQTIGTTPKPLLSLFLRDNKNFHLVSHETHFRENYADTLALGQWPLLPPARSPELYRSGWCFSPNSSPLPMDHLPQTVEIQVTPASGWDCHQLQSQPITLA